MCVLHVSSLTDPFKSFITGTKLPVYQFHEKGEQSTIGKKETFEDYGFSCDVSKKSWNDFEGQLDDIISFILTHRSDLTKLKNNFNISDWRFDLPYYIRLGNNFFSQSDYLSPGLINLLAEFNLGLEMTLYAPGTEKG